MTEFCQKVLDVWTWESIKGLKTQSGVFCDARAAGLVWINDYVSMRCEGERSSPNQLPDGTSPGQLPELIPESLGLVKWPLSMGDSCTKM